MRSLLTAAIAAVALGATVAAAAAESSFCGAMQAEYAALAKRAGSAGRTGNSRAEYERVKAQARRANCNGGFFFFGKRPSAQCPAIMARLNQLQRQLPVFGFGGGFGAAPGFDRWSVQRDQQRLRAAMRREGCGAPSGDNSTWAWGGGGAYRTLCVRACDGFYFPISYSTSPSRFKIDASVCQALYPPGEAELYIHRTGASSDTMVSLKGSAYTAQPFAYTYRESFSPACAERLRAPGSYVASIPTMIGNSSDVIAISVRPDPMPSAAPADDSVPVVAMAPEMLPTPERATEAPAGITVAAIGPLRAATPIRQLGSAYYYEPPAVIDGLKFARMKSSKHRGPTTIEAGMIPNPFKPSGGTSAE